MFRNDQRKGREDQAGSQLLHPTGDHRMGFSGVPPLIDRTERPARHPQLQDQKSIQQVSIYGARARVRREQQGGPHQSHRHAADGRRMQPFSARQQRLRPHHPEWRDGDDQAGDPAGNQ